jgi:hypothetical protein
VIAHHPRVSEVDIGGDLHVSSITSAGQRSNEIIAAKKATTYRRGIAAEAARTRRATLSVSMIVITDTAVGWRVVRQRHDSRGLVEGY